MLEDPDQDLPTQVKPPRAQIQVLLNQNQNLLNQNNQLSHQLLQANKIPQVST